MLPSNCRYSIDAKAVIVVEPARKAFQVCIHERVSPSSERMQLNLIGYAHPVILTT